MLLGRTFKVDSTTVLWSFLGGLCHRLGKGSHRDYRSTGLLPSPMPKDYTVAVLRCQVIYARIVTELMITQD